MEVVVDTLEDFLLMKPYAEYASELTYVLAFNDDQFTSMIRRFPELKSSYQFQDTKQSKPILYWNERKYSFGIKNADAVVMTFLNQYSLTDDIIWYRNYSLLFELLSDGCVELDESAKKVLDVFPRSDRHIGSLICSRDYRKHLRNPKFCFYDIEDATPKSLSLDTTEILEKKWKNFYGLKVDSYMPSEKKIFLYDNHGRHYQLTYYGMLGQMYNEIFKEGNSVSIQAGKVMGNNNDYIIVDWRVIPDGFTSDTTYYVKCGRQYPVSMYNNLWAEFQYRRNKENIDWRLNKEKENG